MLSDPTIVKLIIMGLVGTNVVLLVAVIFLAFKKNTYYVDADGNDVGTTRKPQVKKVIQATPIAPKPKPVQQPKQNVEDSLAATTVLTDLERPVMPISPTIKPIKVDSLDTPIREKNNDDSATLFEEIFSTTNLDEADPKILVTIKVAGQSLYNKEKEINVIEELDFDGETLYYYQGDCELQKIVLYSLTTDGNKITKDITKRTNLDIKQSTKGVTACYSSKENKIKE